MSNALAKKIMKPVVAMTGMQNRLLCKVPVVGKPMVAGTSKMIGKLAPHLGFLGFRKVKSYENALWNWEVFLDLIGAAYEKDVLSPEETVYTFRKCPAGFCCAEHLDACEGTMMLDHTLVEKSGAKLRVDKRIPVDGICVEAIIPA
jgi:hypothetical protein